MVHEKEWQACIFTIPVISVFWITQSQVLRQVLKPKKVVRKYLGTYVSNIIYLQ